ncbi:hypothetical protein A1O1_06095 [Capronia coronata CBS 617.96]|uniref:Uncharacterized protein n=1 Tax=Capronia coronata CBS 617.96 TaxID=1182541 RepID=W9XYT9_9EURO|nr:uncharacterized protein A1O1_06095 [Capronia coronata CBS 617.96]EXJ85727.1 hypothetical protein A1O1_06095 [Capronia coronata CBS 617.96]
MKSSFYFGRPPHATRRPKRPTSPPRPVVERKYDAESGQVYSEVEVRFNRKQYFDWIGEPKTPGLIKKSRPNEHGARSLADMAVVKVAKLLPRLTPEHFAAVPWAIAEKVWKQVLATRRESFHAWRTFAAAYPGEDEFGQPEYRYLLDIKQPVLPLCDYLVGITSPDLSWLTCLRLSPKQMTTVDLVSIHTVTNLAVLDLSDGQVTIDNNVSKFDERVMRSWAELAASGQAFQHLRVLLCGWQEFVSDWIFRYTDSFPSLCHLIVTDCPRMHQRNRGDWEPVSQAAGWEARHSKRSAKSLRPVIGNDDFYYGSVSGCYYDSMALFRDLAHPRRPNVVERLPLLEVWLGSPRQWSHIVDDFPSTRTVFFDNVRTQAWAEREGHSSQAAGRDHTKRLRNSEMISQGTASPPAKRGSKSRATMRSNVPSVVDMLNEFQGR